MRCIAFWRVRLTLWSPVKTSSTSSGVNSCRSIWRMLSSSHSKPETTTEPSYQVVYTNRYGARGAGNPDFLTTSRPTRGSAADPGVRPTKQLRGQLLHRSEEHTSELQSLRHLVCRLLLEKKKKKKQK